MESFDQRNLSKLYRLLRFPSRMFLLWLGLLSSVFVADRSLAQDTAVVKAIEDVIANQVAAWNNGDIDGYMRGYWNSDSTQFSSGGEITRGYERVLARYKQKYRNPEARGKLDFRELNIEPLAPSIAVVTGIWELTRRGDAPWGRFTLIVQKKPEGWRITHDHTSSAEK